MKPASSLLSSTFPLICSSGGARMKPSISSLSSSLEGVGVTCGVSFGCAGSSFARMFNMFERNAPLLLCFSISFRRTSSKYFRSASSFLLYAAVTNFSFPSYRASSFSRSLIRFLEHELSYRCGLLVHNLHFSLPLLCSLLHHGNVFALS